MSTLEVKAIQAPTGFDLQMPAGHIVQTVQSTYATQTSSTSSSFVATGLTASITPSSTANKILILYSFEILKIKFLFECKNQNMLQMF